MLKAASFLTWRMLIFVLFAEKKQTYEFRSRFDINSHSNGTQTHDKQAGDELSSQQAVPVSLNLPSLKLWQGQNGNDAIKILL